MQVKAPSALCGRALPLPKILCQSSPLPSPLPSRALYARLCVVTTQRRMRLQVHCSPTPSCSLNPCHAVLPTLPSATSHCHLGKALCQIHGCWAHRHLGPAACLDHLMTVCCHAIPIANCPQQSRIPDSAISCAAHSVVSPNCDISHCSISSQG